jgi:hypothetical protein
MGTWSASLYDDDAASDLKNTIALVCKVPGDGERLLSTLGVNTAIEFDWTIAYAAFAPGAKGIPAGCALASLLRAC